MPFIHFRPITVISLNDGINADLNLGCGHTLICNNITFPTGCGLPAGIYFLTNNDQYLLIGGGTLSGRSPLLRISGGDNVGAGSFLFTVPRAALDININAMQIIGNTDTPYLDMKNNRIAALKQSTTDMDAVPQTKMWGDWTPTLTWTAGTPTGITRTSRYCQIGKTVYFTFQIDATDSNATTNLSVTLPVNMANATASGVVVVPALEGYGVAGGTWIVLQAFLYNNLINFLNFQPGTDNQALYIRVSGFYEVA
jgi:hypothetical protein